MTIKRFELSIKTVSEANSTEHWTKKSKRHREQKFFVNLALREGIKEITLPCKIKLTRISTRTLDYDNLCSSLKYVLDSVCDLLVPGLRPGQADGDPRITTSYDQEKGKKYAIRIEITSL